MKLSAETMKLSVACALLSTLSLATATQDKRRTYSYGGDDGDDTKVARLVCPSTDPGTFRSFIALSTKNNNGDLGDTLRDAHRVGTALECDPFHRSLTDASQVGNEPDPSDKTVSLELYEVTVLSYDTPDPETALELDQSPRFVSVENDQKNNILCTLDAITGNEDFDGRCPRFGCYCPTDLLGPAETKGLTEVELTTLLNDDGDAGGYGSYGYGYGGRKLDGKGKGKGGKKGGGPPVTVVEAVELQAFPCGESSVQETNFQFVLDVEDICSQVTPRELIAFTDEFVRLCNLAQFNGCDGAFRRLQAADPITNCDPSRRNLQFGNAFLNSTLLLNTLFVQFDNPNRTSTLFTGDVRRRLDDPSSLYDMVENFVPSLLSAGKGNTNTPRRLTDEDPEGTELTVDYGDAFNFDNGECFCSAFTPRTGNGITSEDLNSIARQAISFATDERVDIVEAVEQGLEGCGLPKVFTQRVRVTAEGSVGKQYYYSTDEQGILQGLAELICCEMQDLAEKECVSTYLEIIDITLVGKEAEEISSRQKFTKLKWNLLFDIQYVMVGVVDQDDAQLFSSNGGRRRSLNEKASASSSGIAPLSVAPLPGDRKLDEVDVYFQLQDLDTVLGEIDCDCDPTTDILSLKTINRRLNRRIYEGAVPGLYYSVIKE
mmetsp:Transcript_26079/g.60000  ORF Transcript_26079/g.60000 Transcript_26079/m.60000 type:complete len:659 (+) Transcript_26079:109-2085(+)